jgi:hypothetical protein
MFVGGCRGLLIAQYGTCVAQDWLRRVPPVIRSADEVGRFIAAVWTSVLLRFLLCVHDVCVCFVL